MLNADQRDTKWVQIAEGDLALLRAKADRLDAALTRIRTEDLSRFDCTLIAAEAQGFIR